MASFSAARSTDDLTPLLRTDGNFVYHCHLLEHEDAGMMGTIRVEPAKTQVAQQKH